MNNPFIELLIYLDLFTCIVIAQSVVLELLNYNLKHKHASCFDNYRNLTLPSNKRVSCSEKTRIYIYNTNITLYAVC